MKTSSKYNIATQGADAIKPPVVSIVCNEDCMNVMAHFPSKYFDLAIVDPLYGIGPNWRKDTQGKFHKHKNKFNKTYYESQEKRFKKYRQQQHLNLEYAKQQQPTTYGY